MTEKFSFDDLSDTEFEEFCYDLLKELDFKNINWRKGTGKTTSPSDGGRDIECESFVEDIDGKINKEKWFFECKHYKKGVPPQKIQGALSWANAEKPDKLVFVVSNFLSNPCKEYLKKYIQENKPSFKIKYWELKELEDLSFGKSQLLNKHSLSKGLDFVKIMHPLHLKYISKPSVNTLDYFFSILDNYDSKKRDEIVQNTAYFFIDPQYKKPITGKETIKELQIDKTDYKALKKKCYALKSHLTDAIIVRSIVNITLEWAFHYADKTSVDAVITRNKSINEFMKEQLKTAKNEKKEILKKLIKDTEERIKNLPKQTEHWYSLYTDFCEEILSRLMEEDIMSKIEEINESFL